MKSNKLRSKRKVRSKKVRSNKGRRSNRKVKSKVKSKTIKRKNLRFNKGKRKTLKKVGGMEGDDQPFDPPVVRSQTPTRSRRSSPQSRRPPAPAPAPAPVPAPAAARARSRSRARRASEIEDVHDRAAKVRADEDWYPPRVAPSSDTNEQFGDPPDDISIPITPQSPPHGLGGEVGLSFEESTSSTEPTRVLPPAIPVKVEEVEEGRHLFGDIIGRGIYESLENIYDTSLIVTDDLKSINLGEILEILENMDITELDEKAILNDEAVNIEPEKRLQYYIVGSRRRCKIMEYIGVSLLLDLISEFYREFFRSTGGEDHMEPIDVRAGDAGVSDAGPVAVPLNATFEKADISEIDITTLMGSLSEATDEKISGILSLDRRERERIPPQIFREFLEGRRWGMGMTYELVEGTVSQPLIKGIDAASVDAGGVGAAGGDDGDDDLSGLGGGGRQTGGSESGSSESGSGAAVAIKTVGIIFFVAILMGLYKLKRHRELMKSKKSIVKVQSRHHAYLDELYAGWGAQTKEGRPDPHHVRGVTGNFDVRDGELLMTPEIMRQGQLFASNFAQDTHNRISAALNLAEKEGDKENIKYLTEELHMFNQMHHQAQREEFTVGTVRVLTNMLDIQDKEGIKMIGKQTVKDIFLPIKSFATPLVDAIADAVTEDIESGLNPDVGGRVFFAAADAAADAELPVSAVAKQAMASKGAFEGELGNLSEEIKDNLSARESVVLKAFNEIFEIPMTLPKAGDEDFDADVYIAIMKHILRGNDGEGGTLDITLEGMLKILNDFVNEDKKDGKIKKIIKKLATKYKQMEDFKLAIPSSAVGQLQGELKKLDEIMTDLKEVIDYYKKPLKMTKDIQKINQTQPKKSAIEDLMKFTGPKTDRDPHHGHVKHDPGLRLVPDPSAARSSSGSSSTVAPPPAVRSKRGTPLSTPGSPVGSDTERREPEPEPEPEPITLSPEIATPRSGTQGGLPLRPTPQGGTTVVGTQVKPALPSRPTPQGGTTVVGTQVKPALPSHHSEQDVLVAFAQADTDGDGAVSATDLATYAAKLLDTRETPVQDLEALVSEFGWEFDAEDMTGPDGAPAVGVQGFKELWKHLASTATPTETSRTPADDSGR